MKPLLIGQAPSKRTDGLPAFSGSSGKRLAALAGVERLTDAFDVANVFDHWPGPNKTGDRFPIFDARVRARRMLPLLEGRTVVFVGQGVARAFGADASPLGCVSGRFTGFTIPHPSGLNRWYNDEENVRAVAELLRTLAAGGSRV